MANKMDQFGCMQTRGEYNPLALSVLKTTDTICRYPWDHKFQSEVLRDCLNKARVERNIDG